MQSVQPEHTSIRNMPPKMKRQPGPARSCLWGFLGAGGCLVALAALVVLVAFSGIAAFGGLGDRLLAALNPTTPTPTATAVPPATPTGVFIPTATSTAAPTFTPIPSPTPDYTQSVVQNVQLMGQLVSVSWQLAEAQIEVSVRQGVLDACSFSNQHVAEGVIEAGIDLAGFTAADVQYDPASNTYTLTLPAPQLTSCRIDDIQQYSGSVSLCGVNRDDARRLAQYIAILGFRDDALEDGILARAQQQAALVIGNFVRATTGSGVQIAFRQPNSALPGSCAPDIPQGWVFNAAENFWTRP